MPRRHWLISYLGTNQIAPGAVQLSLLCWHLGIFAWWLKFWWEKAKIPRFFSNHSTKNVIQLAKARPKWAYFGIFCLWWLIYSPEGVKICQVVRLDNRRYLWCLKEKERDVLMNEIMVICIFIYLHTAEKKNVYSSSSPKSRIFVFSIRISFL